MVVVTHQAEKIWTYDRTTVQSATFNMRGQLYRGHANATALSSSPVVSALGSESDDPSSNPGWGKALCPWDVREKKKFFTASRPKLPRCSVASDFSSLLIKYRECANQRLRSNILVDVVDILIVREKLLP